MKKPAEAGSFEHRLLYRFLQSRYWFCPVSW